MKVTIDVTEKELNSLEDYLICWNLCDKHKKESWKKTDVQIYKMAYACRKCEKIKKQKWGLCWKVQGKLWDAYIKKSKKAL